MNRLRRRFAAMRMASPLDRWCTLALQASLALGWCSLALGMEAAGTATPPRLVAVAGLLLLPRLAELLRPVLEGSDPRGIFATAVQWTGGLICGGILFFVAPFATIAAWMHGLAAARPRRDSAVGLAFALGLVEALSPLVTAPSAPASALFVLQFFVACLGGTWLHARATRRRFLVSTDERYGAPENCGGLSSRSLTLGALAVLVALSIALLEGGVAAVESSREARRMGPLVAEGSGGSGSALDGGRPSGSAGESADGEARDAEQATRERAERLRSIWPEELAFEGALSPGQERIMAQIQCTLDTPDQPWFGPDRPLYLRARTFEHLDDDGLNAGGGGTGEVYNDGGTGIEDGWVELLPARPRRDAALYGIRMREHRLSGGGFRDRHSSVLLHTAQLINVEAPSIRIVPGEGIFVEPREDGMLEYRWTAASWKQGRAVLTADRADSKLLALPASDPRFSEWAVRGRELTAGAADADEAIARVLRHFEEEWSYTLQPAPGTRGIDALEAFFELRRGYCVSFATAAMIYLRASGIPCRVVTGYRTSRYRRPNVEKEGFYEAYNSDAHAWLEVALTGGHWRRVETTPDNAYQAALTEAGLDPDRSPGEGLPEDPAEEDALAAAEDPSVAEEEDEGAFAGVRQWLDTLGRGLGLPDSSRLLPFALILPLVILMQIATLYQLRRIRRREQGDTPPADAAVGYWRELVRVLRGYGFHPRRGQTPREYAHQVREFGGPLFAGIGRVVDVLYRDRFGRLAPDEADEKLIDDYRELVDSPQFRERWKRATRG